jgi:hypothetical protein
MVMTGEERTAVEQRLKSYQKELTGTEIIDPGESSGFSWIVSDPFRISGDQYREMEQIGEEIRKFLLRCWKMSRDMKCQDYFYQSLSQDEKRGVERLSGENRFPVLARPDMIIDEEGKFWITEVDLVPAGAGDLQRMQEIYGQSPTIADQWAEVMTEELILSVPEWKKNFVSEQSYFVRKVQERHGQISFLTIEEWHSIRDYRGLLFKNCCTISLLNENYPPHVPSKAVFCPPVILDWKGWMALAHREDGLKELPLTKRIPETYLLPLKPERETEERRALLDISRSERREWIMKPVGSWGALGFQEATGLTRDEWNRKILGLPEEVSQGMLLQRKVDSTRYEYVGLEPMGVVSRFEKMRIRISPFYLYWKGKSRLLGATVTLRNSVKVHGAKDAIYTIAVVS